VSAAAVIDRIAIECIAQADEVIDIVSGRRYLVACGGRFTRIGAAWQFEANGMTVVVSVPSTIAALEQRAASTRGRGMDGLLADVLGTTFTFADGEAEWVNT
jgi:hypothetical protein